MAIPIISEIIQLLVGFWNNAPTWIKILIFIASASVFISIFQGIFEWKGCLPFDIVGYCPYYKQAWGHRVFLPQECLEAQNRVLITNKSGFITEIPADIQIGTVVKLNETNCPVIRDCINDYVNDYNRSSECNKCLCLKDALGFTSLNCYGTIGYPYYLLGFPCSDLKINSSGVEMKLGYYCAIQNYKNITITNETLSSDQELLNTDKCAKGGFDYLNSSFMWFGTLLIVLFGATFKVAQLTGLFNQN